jgi:hypothetical protein
MVTAHSRGAALLCAGLLVLAAAAAADPKFTFLDLQPKGNHRLAEDLHGTQGNHLGGVPQGELKFEGSRWKIGEQMIHLRGENAKDAPEAVEGIKVGAKFDRLHILHSTGYGENPQFTEGTEIGAYTVVYADDTTERIPIIYGDDVRDWWDWPERMSLKRAKVAWTGTNPPAMQNERKVRLFGVVWTNPHPGKEVQTIGVNSSDTPCDPFVVALTIETK